MDIVDEESAKRFIEKIYKENKEYYSDERGEGMLKVLDRVHNSKAYIAEILQNAIDAGATKIHYTIKNNNKLVIEHNGKKFSRNDVKNISRAGTSKKLADDIGFMGIGFKSVFERYNEVSISSPPWKFSYSCSRGDYGQIDQVNKTLPEWNNELSIPSKEMTCRFELNKPILDDGMTNSKEQIKNDLNSVMGDNNNLLVLLARQGIEELKWDNILWLLEQEKVNLDYKNVLAGKITAIGEAENNNLFDEWIHFSREYSITDSARKNFLSHRQIEPDSLPRSNNRKVEAFVRLNKDGYPILPEKGKSYAVLPMDSELPIGLNIQADWLVEATRNKPLNNNNWHKLILRQIPVLIAAFLKWTKSLDIKKYEHLKYFNCLPDLSSMYSGLAGYINSNKFRKKLSKELESLKFLPVLNGNNEYKYISPEEAVFLQKPFTRLNDMEFKPWLLLGDNYVFRNILTNKACSTLEELGLKKKIQLEDLIDLWDKKTIKKWIKNLEINQNKALITIYDISFRLYGESDAKFNKIKSKIKFIPSETNNWITIDRLKILPKDWNNFIETNSKLEESLKNVILNKYEIIDFELWNYYSNNKFDRTVDSFFETVKRLNLEEIFNSWWKRLSSKPDDTIIDLIYDLTWKAISANRPKLIKKVFALSENEKVLLYPNKTILSAPYASEVRSKIFNDFPVLDPDYYNNDPKNRTAKEWYTFFSKLDPAPNGDFNFNFKTEIYDRFEAKEKYKELGVSYYLPEHRSSDYKIEWQKYESNESIEIENNEYIFIEPNLPEKWPKDEEISYNKAKLLVSWMAESAQKISRYDSMEIAYIPFGQSYIREEKINDINPEWVKKLNKKSWVPAKDRKQVLPPSKILKELDITRPEVPVADLPSELIKRLEKAGIKFGTDIPKAPVLERLKKNSSKLSVDDFYKLLEKAIEEANKDEEVEKEFKKIIKDDLLLPGRQNKKVRYYKFINCENNFLDNFLINYKEIPDENKSKKVLKLINQFLPFPNEITFEQILAYLKYIWEEELNPNEIKQQLIFAYEKLNSFLKSDSVIKKKWDKALNEVKIYTKNSGWMALKNNIYYDDLNYNFLQGELYLVEGSFLGNDEEIIKQTVENHKLSTLKEYFEIRIKIKGEEESPEIWNTNLLEIKNLVKDNFNIDIITPEIKICQDIKIKVFRKGELWKKEKNKNVVRENNLIYVNDSNLNKIARKLTSELLDFWELKSDVHFSKDLGFLINQLDNREALLTNIDEIRDELDLPLIISSNKQQKSKGEDNQETNEKTQKIEEGNNEKDRVEKSKKLSNKKQEAEETSNIASSSNEISSHDNKNKSKHNSNYNSGNKSKQHKSGNRSKNNKSYNINKRKGALENLINKVEKQLDMEIKPKDIAATKKEDLQLNSPKNNFQSDEIFREKVMDYEKRAGRFPEEQEDTQEGYDIISYDNPGKTRVSRYIEVKGINTKWEKDVEVTMSKRQLFEAFMHKKENREGEYWLYIVENDSEDYNVIPIINPGDKSAIFSLKAKHWRWLSKIQQ